MLPSPAPDPDQIPLGPIIVPPRLPGRVVMRDDRDLSIDAMLADLYIHATNCVRAFGDFHFAVSATPESESALMRLMYEPSFREFPWQRTRLWMVDEVDVAADDPQHRGTRLTETIIACSGIPESQCHLLNISEGLEMYEKQLREHLGWREKGHDRLDFVLLTLDEAGRLTVLDRDHAPDMQRPRMLTLPPGYVSSARFIAIYAGATATSTGIANATKWARANRDSLMPMGGELFWYLNAQQISSGPN